MNKTKIIATIGPASSDETTLKSLITDGMDVVRLNLTHADYDFCTDVIDKIHKLNEELKQAIKEERYEDAAKIRDEIKKLDK